MHNHDVKYRSRPGFEPGTFRLQSPVDTNEPSGRPLQVCMFVTVAEAIVTKLTPHQYG